ncbi:deoxyribonuclease TATDN2 [Caerostris extrusa]|uniref:Deoxyribonuclease TATDN2 n=1 Tax=Caerostris extrusa TaxID=172846 RepID=A0AAV4YCL7_CAEEX|nr:deoxyribonuclease TATDN2 [Caerostris extrusa]
MNRNSLMTDIMCQSAMDCSTEKKTDWQKHVEEENVWAAFGCHPHSAADYNDNSEKALKIVLSHPKVRALGEIGLDYSGTGRQRNRAIKNQQFLNFPQPKIHLDPG